MILVGPPGPLIDAICAAVAAAAGDALVIVRDTPGAIDPNEPNRLHVVALLDVANRNAHDTVVVAIDEGLASFARLRSRGFGPLEALRWLTLSDAVLGQRAAAGMPVLTRHSLADPAALLRHFGLTASSQHPLDVLPDDPLPGPQDRAMLAKVLPDGLAFGRYGRRHALIWPLACLFNGDRPDEQAPASVELAGPARVLVFGPYFHLPPGLWRLRASLRFSRRCAGVWFALELRGGERYGRCRFQAEQCGVFTADFIAEVLSPDEPLEVRLALERGAIDGNVSLVEIAFAPLSSDPQPVQRDRPAR